MKDRRRPSFGHAGVWFVAVSMLSTGLVAAACRQGAGTARARTGYAANLDAGQAASFIAYNESIALAVAQQKTMDAALSGIPAPCCAEYSMATCCCPCNLAKSAWGLSKYLIAERGYSAPKVKKTAVEWLSVINPGGFSGDACFSGGCGRPFAQNGCGGMSEDHLVGANDAAR